MWNYPVKSLSKLPRGKTSNHHEDLCLNCFNSYSTENRLKEHEEICNEYDSCRTRMSKSILENIIICLWRKIIKSSISSLSWFRMFTKKRAILPKQSWKIVHKEKSYAWAFWLGNIYKMLIWCDRKGLHWKIVSKVKRACNENNQLQRKRNDTTNW